MKQSDATKQLPLDQHRVYFFLLVIGRSTSSASQPSYSSLSNGFRQIGPEWCIMWEIRPWQIGPHKYNFCSVDTGCRWSMLNRYLLSYWYFCPKTFFFNFSPSELQQKAIEQQSLWATKPLSSKPLSDKAVEQQAFGRFSKKWYPKQTSFEYRIFLNSFKVKKNTSSYPTGTYTWTDQIYLKRRFDLIPPSPPRLWSVMSNFQISAIHSFL